MQRLVNNKKLVDQLQVLTRFPRFDWSGGTFSSSNLGSYFTSIEKKRGNAGLKKTIKRLLDLLPHYKMRIVPHYFEKL